ncbi:hypothetical protein, partial [Treponema succinifaciens]|uniref:hypothetical protein n=1 Tax=Treponema succinifaciens TaxID=167 RepID=UPI003FEFC0B7
LYTNVIMTQPKIAHFLQTLKQRKLKSRTLYKRYNDATKNCALSSNVKTTQAEITYFPQTLKQHKQSNAQDATQTC